MKIILLILTVLFLASFSYGHRIKNIEAALRRVTHPGLHSAFKIAQEVVTDLQDHQQWLSRIVALTLPDCPTLQNCSNTQNYTSYFQCLVHNIQSIIDDCLPAISNSDPDQLFKELDTVLQNYLHNTQQISIECSADLSFHWISLMKLATAGGIQIVCQSENNVSNCKDLLKWAGKAPSESIWALTPIDASAKIPPGFAEGNFHWDGSLKQCKSINQQKDGRKFIGQYCLQAIGFPEFLWTAVIGTQNDRQNSPTNLPPVTTQSKNVDATTAESVIFNSCEQPLQLLVATCMPDSCNKDDVKRAYDILTFGTLSQRNLLCDAHCVPNSKGLPKSADSILWLVLAGVSLTIAFCGTCYDYFVYRPQLKAAEDSNKTFDRQPTFGKILIAFSLYTNLKRLLEMKKRSGQVHCLHGIRSLSMTWVICGHVYAYASSGDNVLTTLTTIPKQFIDLVIINATPSVDTFFLLSGFLLCFLWFKEMDRSKGKKLKSTHFWIMYYVHRYLRLTPLLAVIVWGAVSVFPYIAEGPFFDPATDPIVQNCRDNWWATLLYINNVYKPDNECYDVTWYLSNDTQFYVVAPIVLVLLYKYPKVGLGLCGFLLATCAATKAWVTVDHDFPPTLTLTADLSEYYADPGIMSLMYLPPWTRYGPYVVGLLLGFIMYKISLKKEKFQMPPFAVLIGWILAAGICSAVIFGLHNYTKTGQMSLANRAFYSGVHRTFWAIGVAWVILACHTGYGGIVDRFLSWPIFIPMSRLTYAMYLLHPTFNLIYFGTQDRNTHWDDNFHWTTIVIGIVIWSCLFAIPFSCLFELPILTLEKVFFHPPQIDSKPKAQNGIGPTANGAE